MIVPKAFRRPTDPVEAAERQKLKDARPKEWNPYAIFILLGVLVGSNAIQLISLRNEVLNFNRKTDAKLELLREVVQRVKNGEDVDVKRLLGTGDPQQEKEWEDVMHELERTDMLWEGKKKREAKMAEKAEQRRIKEQAREREESSPIETGGSGQAADTKRPKFIM